MNPWRSLLRSLQAELERCSQEVGGRKVLPNAVDVALPESQFESQAPILRAATAEVGKALVDWAENKRRIWYGDAGPYLNVHLEGCPRAEIICEFKKIESG